jgi:hypothetical protein
VALGLITSAKQLNNLLAALPQSIDNPLAWATTLQTQFYNQVPATIESSDRKTMYIKPTQDYPAGNGQFVIVILQGFINRASGRGQQQSVYVGGFWHQNQYQIPIGMADPKTWLRDGIFR